MGLRKVGRNARVARGVKVLFAASGPPGMGVMVTIEPAPIVNVPVEIEVAVS